MAVRFCSLLLALGCLLLAAAARAQVYLNLGLEPRLNHGQPLVLWSQTVPPTGQLALDSTVRRQGQSSLRLDLPATLGPARIAYFSTNLVPLDSVKGQLLTVSAWVRTQNWRGRLALSATATTLTAAGLSHDTGRAEDSLPGTTDWRRLELRVPVKATAHELSLALWAKGNGQVWLDAIQLSIKGQPLPDSPVPATEALLLPLEELLVPNWDFERLPPRLTRPAATLATAALDSASPQHGRRYLRLLRRSPASQLPQAVYLGTLPVSPRDAGKRLRVAGYWRCPGPASPAAPPQFAVRLLISGPWSQQHWRSYPLSLPAATAAPGSRWTAFSFEVPVQLGLSADNERVALAALSLSVLLPDPRPLELDNLTFSLDGQPYAPAGPPTPPPPTREEIAWLRSALKPLRLAAPATAGPDLAALGSLLASARLVGLGEVTHGSHEVFALHEQLTRHLIGQKGFGGLLLDASPAGCAALSDYVRTGQGDPARLLTTLGEGWNTPELLALLRWLREQQRTHPATPLLLAGLDMQQPEQALASLRQLTEPDDDFAQTRLQRIAQLLASFRHPAADDPDLLLHPDQPQDSLLAPLRRVLNELRAGLDDRAMIGGHPASLRTLARRRYYLRLVEQGATWRRLSLPASFNYRQACLAENAQYLREQEASNGRLVLWANNTSVAGALSLTEKPMGQWLRATLGTGYLALGAVLGQGSYAAAGPGGKWASAPLAAPRPGAYEAWLNTGPAAFWLPLSALALDDDNAWLFQEQLLRDIGPAAARNQYMLHSLRNEFDAVVFLRESTATQPLP